MHYDNNVYSSMSDREAMQLIAVFACVRLLADSIASLPIDVYKKDGLIRKPVEPEPLLTRDPLPEITQFEWMYMTVTALATRGNSFHLIVGRDDDARAQSLFPVHPDLVFIDRDQEGRKRFSIGGTWYRESDVLHIKRFPSVGYEYGLSPISEAASAIDIGLQADKFGRRYFRDSASPSSVLETEQELSDAAAEHLKRQWIASHAGKRHPAVLSGGIKWRPISITPEESQFLETRKFQRAEIATLYGIPPHMIGDTEKSTSWGTGIEAQSLGFVKFTLTPWLECIESALTKLLPRGQEAKFNVDALLRGDLKSRYQAYTESRYAGWQSINEIRSREDLPPIGPEGDEFIQPLNMTPVDADRRQQGDDPSGDMPDEEN